MLLMPLLQCCFCPWIVIAAAFTPMLILTWLLCCCCPCNQGYGTEALFLPGAASRTGCFRLWLQRIKNQIYKIWKLSWKLESIGTRRMLIFLSITNRKLQYKCEFFFSYGPLLGWRRSRPRKNEQSRMHAMVLLLRFLRCWCRPLFRCVPVHAVLFYFVCFFSMKNTISR